MCFQGRTSRIRWCVWCPYGVMQEWTASFGQTPETMEFLPNERERLGGKCQKFSFRLAVLRCVSYQVEMSSRQLNIWGCNLRERSALEIQIWGFSAHRYHETRQDHQRTVCGRERRGSRAEPLVSATLRGREKRRNLQETPGTGEAGENKNGCLEGKWAKGMREWTTKC